MTIETHEEYEEAIARLAALGDHLSEREEQDEFFEISAAMVDYETRNHSALKGRR